MVKNDLIIILSARRKTVADVHRATGIPTEIIEHIYYERADNYGTKDIMKICDYLNVTLEEFLGRDMPVRNQYRQRVMFNKLVRRTVGVDELIRKEEADD